MINLLLATVLSVSLQNGHCYQVANNLVAPITVYRDQGFSLEYQKEALLNLGHDENFILALLVVIYQKKSHLNPEEMVADYLNWCLGEDV